MKTKIVLLMFLSITFFLGTAQVPQGFNYQAIARNASGDPITNTLLPVRITIQSDSLGGTTYWIEEHSSVTTNNFGLFTLVLGRGVRKTGSVALTFNDIDWTVTPKFIKTEINSGGWKNMGSSRLWTVPYSMVAGKLEGAVQNLEVVGEDVTSDDALFEVKRKDGETMFAVYNHGVRVYMPLDTNSKARKGGFAVGGFTKTKGTTTFQDYFVVNPDSIRAYIDTNSVKSRKGGFAVGGFSRAKAGTLNEEYLRVTRDSTRIYINDEGTKSRKGGFAVGGFDKTKGGNDNFFNVATDANGIINPSQNRILWYPLKNAFLTGKVLIQKPDSVGVNSFATGYESKAKGQYSQALGYKAIARGDYSTAIGKNSIANKTNSFSFGDSVLASARNSYAFGKKSQATGDGSYAFGYNAIAKGQDSYAFGTGAEARGIGSFAMGFIGRDSAGSATGNTLATIDYAVAIGMGAQAKAMGAFAIGVLTLASSNFSTALGYKTSASGYASTAIGYNTATSGSNGVALGSYSSASGDYSLSLGEGSISTKAGAIAINGGQATGDYSIAIGGLCKSWYRNSLSIGYNINNPGTCSIAIGDSANTAASYAISMGYKTWANGSGATSIGYQTQAIGPGSIALGNKSFAWNYYSTAIGNQASSNADYAWSLGDHTIANGLESFAIGTYSKTSARFSTSMGFMTDSRGDFSNAFGYYTNSKSFMCTVFGAFNDTTCLTSTTWDPGDPLFIVGNGTSTNNHKNAFTIYKNGNAYIQGNVGIGTNTPGYKLQVGNAADGSQARANAWNLLSDTRLKTSFTKPGNSLEMIEGINGYYFYWNTGSDKTRQFGFSAQEVEKVLPEIVSKGADGLLALDYGKITPLLVEAIKEQQKQIESFKSEIRTLQEKVDRIEALLAKALDE